MNLIRNNIYRSGAEIAIASYALLLETGRAGGSAALSFGSTYTPIFRSWKKLCSAAAKKPPMPAFFPADERLVAIDDERSNWGLARKLFIDECGTESDRGHWPQDAEAYGRILEEVKSEDGLPVFDLIFLGLGPDGHTASIFPGGCPAAGSPEWMKPVLETTAPFDPPRRLSLGPEVLVRAGKLVLIVTGEAKTSVLSTFRRELEAESPQLPPARIVRRRSELGIDTILMTDSAADGTGGYA